MRLLPTIRRRQQIAASLVFAASATGGSVVAAAVMDGPIPITPPTASPSTFPPAAAKRPAATPVGDERRRRAFSARACRALEPNTNPVATVVIDAGHGGREPGAVAENGTTEAEITLAVVQKVIPRLLEDGYRVVVTRTGAAAVARPRAADLDGELLTPAAVKRELETRNRCANLGGGDALLSVHLNSAAEQSVRGVQTIYNPRRRFAAQSRRLASALHSSVLEDLQAAGWPTGNQRLITDQRTGGPALTPQGAQYGQLLLLGPAWRPWFRTPSLMPAAVVETGFITSPAELEWFTDSERQQVLADALVRGVNTYFRR